MTQTKTLSYLDRTDPGWGQDWRAPLVMTLGALLVLQLLLALGLGLRGPDMTAASTQMPLLAFAPDQITRVRIEGAGDAVGVTLNRNPDGQWVLADPADFPTAPGKVEQLLTQLAALKRPLPVATSEEARQRFKVADTGFERRLTLEGKDGPLGVLLLGDSPGFKRLFGRPADDPAVYDLSLSLADVSIRRDDWLETGLLRMEQEQIARITGADWTLLRDRDGWRLEGGDQPVDQARADDVAMRIANLGYRGVLGTTDQPAYRQQEPKLTLTVGLADGASRSYRISQVENSQDYALKDADRPYYFRLSAYDLEGLLDLHASQLTIQPAAPDQPDATAEPPTSDETATP